MSTTIVARKKKIHDRCRTESLAAGRLYRCPVQHIIELSMGYPALSIDLLPFGRLYFLEKCCANTGLEYCVLLSTLKVKALRIGTVANTTARPHRTAAGRIHRIHLFMPDHAGRLNRTLSLIALFFFVALIVSG